MNNRTKARHRFPGSMLFLAGLSAFSSWAAKLPPQPVLRLYEGARPAEQEVALRDPLMKCTWTTVCQRAGVVSIDGKKIGHGWSGVSKSEEFRLLPGKHVVEFWLVNGSASGGAVLWFVGEAGRTYSVQYKPHNFSYTLHIDDDVTGLPVGGIKGSSDEPADEAPSKSSN